MSKYSIFVISLMLSISSLFAEVDCPSDSAYHVDMRSMLPDGSPNPSYGQQISTGLQWYAAKLYRISVLRVGSGFQSSSGLSGHELCTHASCGREPALPAFSTDALHTPTP